MSNTTLSQQFAIIALNGLDCDHASVAKDAALRGIAAANILEKVSSTDGAEAFSAEEIVKVIKEATECAKNLKKKEAKELEAKMQALLLEANAIELVPDLLGCDMYYQTAGVTLKAYRSDEHIYLRICEQLRAEVLEEGEMTLESAMLLWLNRETGCMHDLFSVEEQKVVQKRMLDLSVENAIYRAIWESEFHHMFEKLTVKFLKAKSTLFKNPYMEGIGVTFPFLERRKAIFIDQVVFGSSVASRRVAAMEYLSQMGHYVEEVKNGSETLLKIDNCYYRIIPSTRTCKVPIQGVDLVPVYW